MRVIVTGGAGFIGSHIVQALVESGVEVKVIDNLSTGKLENLSEVMDKIEFIEGDITDLRLLQKEFAGFDYVLHQAALNSAPRSIDNPLATSQNNIDGTLKVLIAARDNQINRVVYASSSSIYGDIESDYKTENMPPNPGSPYSLSKYAGEVYCKLFTKLYGLDTLCLRYFNVFGPRQNPNSQYSAAIPKFINAILRNQSPTIFGDGNQSRDFTYVQNVVQANLLAIDVNRGNGETINIACGENFTINQVLKLINQQLNTDIQAFYVPERPGDVRRSHADVSKAEKLLNYRPMISFEDGMVQTVKWYKKESEKILEKVL